MNTKQLLFFILLHALTYGQFKTDVSPMTNFHSPNASALGTFGDTPVSLYNGSPEIKIPIHKLTERGIELDINLQYNPRGVRVEEVPGWVGQNWTLNAGGVITRSVRGTAFDELNFFHNKDINQIITPYLAEWPTSNNGQWYKAVFQRGYFYHTDKLNTTQWNNPTYLQDLAYNSYLNFTTQNYMQTLRAQNWRMDLEPDIFTFNFMGHTGSFFLGQDGKWKVFSDSNLKIECDLNNDIDYPVPSVPASGIDGLTSNPFMIRFPKVINKITITDDNGTKFLFDQVELSFNNFTVQRPPYNKDSRCISSAFYLTKVTDSFNNIVYEFQYEKGPWQGKFNISYDVSLYSLTNDEVPVTNTAITSFNPGYIDWHKLGFSAPGQLILPNYLKKIKCASGVEIKFNSTLVENALKYTRGGNSLIDDRTETYYGTYKGNNLDLYFLFKNPDLVTDSNIPVSTPVWDILKNKKLTGIEINDNSGNLFNVSFDFIDLSGIRLFLKELKFNDIKKYKFDYNGYYLPIFLSLQTDALGYFNNNEFKFTTITNDINYWSNELPILKQTNNNIVTGTLSKITYPTGGTTQFQFEPHIYSKKLTDNNELISSSGTIGGLRIKKIINSFDNNVTETKEYLYQKNINDNTSSGNLIYNPIYFKNLGAISHPLQNIFNGAKMYCRSLNSLVSMSNFMGVQLEYTDVIEKTTNNGYTHYKFSNYNDYPDFNPVALHNAALKFTPKTDQSYERGKLKEKLIYNNDGLLLQKKELKYFSNGSLFLNAVNINFDYHIPCIGCNGLGDTFWFLPFTSAYRVPYTDKYMVEEETHNYTSNGTITTFIANDYIRPNTFGTIINNGSLYKKKEYLSSLENNYGILKKFNYPFETNNTVNNSMVAKNILPVISENTYSIEGSINDPDSSIPINEKKLDYQSFNSLTNELIVPKESFFRKGDNVLEKEFVYTNFDDIGNVTEYKKDNGVYVSVIWGYKSSKPIAVLENVRNSEIQLNVINDLKNLSENDIDHGIEGTTEKVLKNALNSLRDSFPSAMVKTFTYDPLLGPTSITEYDGQTKYFEYDDLLRLKIIRNKQGDILKEYQYNYRPSYNPED